MTVICKNCGQQFEGNFCGNCGQKADTQKIDFKFLWKRIKHLLFKYSDSGFWYSTKQLVTRPGDSIREYIEGKRVKHYEPLTLLLTLAAVYGFLYHYFHINIFTGVLLESREFEKIDLKIINEWISNHYSLVTCLIVPFYSVGSFIAFRKQGYNFVEHLTLNTFLASQRLLLRIVTFPLLLIFTVNSLSGVYIFIDIILLTWSYCQFFNKLTTDKAMFLSILSYVIFFICFMILTGIVLYAGSSLAN